MSETAKVTASDEKKQQPAAKSSIFARIKSIKNIELIVAGIAVLIMFVIYFGSKVNLSPSSNSNNTQANSKDYCAQMEEKLADTLSNLKGAGSVKVIINWESSVESVIAYITSSSQNSETSSPQIIQSSGSSQPIVLREVYPKALGVIIICQGGENVSVKLDIINAVSTLLNLTPDKISVYPMNNNKK